LNIFKDKLESGEWGPGDRLPTLPTLADTYLVSVATIREALRVLQSQGLISIEQGRGSFVNQDVNDILNKASRINSESDLSIPIKDLIYLIDVRSVLEPAFAETAAKQAFPDEVKAITRSAQRMADLVEKNKSTIEEDMLFHMLVVRATHNEIWVEIYEHLQERLHAARGHTNIPKMKAKAAHYHSIIAEAIQDRDPERAKMYMKSHMEGNRELVLYQFSNGLKD